MPSKQDIAIAKGLAKEAGKMVAEELAKMLVPGIGWFTGLVSVLKLIKAVNDPGDESRPVELALRVAQDARFCIRLYEAPGRFYVLDFYDVNRGPNKMPKTLLPNSWGKSASLDRNLVQVGKDFDADKFNTAGKVRQLQSKKFGTIAYTNNPDNESGFVVGYNRSKKRDLELIALGADVLVAQLLSARPELKQYETDLLAGATITIAALKVSAAADLFNNDMKPNFNEANPAPLIQYGKALAEYVELVNTLGTLPAGIAESEDPLIFKPMLGIVASQIAESFGLDLAANFVTFKPKGKRGETIRDIYTSQIEGNRKTVPGTTAVVDVSMPGSPLDKPAATPPPPSLPDSLYTIMPIAGSTVPPGLKTKLELNELVKPTIEQPLETLELAGNVSAAGDSGTKPAGPTDSSVLVLVAAAAAALALL